MSPTSRTRRLEPFLPALLLALFAFYCGRLDSVTAPQVGLALLLWLGLAALALYRRGSAAWRDPLQLGGSPSGQAGRWLPLVLYALVILSCWTSPVPRAGWLVVLVLPLLYLTPAAVQACWRDPRSRRLGLPAVTVVVVAVAVAALVGLLQGDARAAEPLGQHILLATFLLALWPLALGGVLHFSTYAPTWATMVLAVLLGIGTTAAIVKSGSLIGMATFLLQALIVASWRSSALTNAAPASPAPASPASAGPAPASPAPAGPASNRTRMILLLLLAGGFVLTLIFGPRLLEIATLRDTSLQARLDYWQAGLRGVEHRPWLGWGPGSTPWTLSEHLRPHAGVRPAAEVVGDLHGVPQQIAYELGLPALLLALALGALWWWRRRTAETATEVGAVDRLTGRCARLGVLGFVVASVGSGSLIATALPMALLALLGAAQAVEQPLQPEDSGRPEAQPEPRALLPRLLLFVPLLLIAALLLPLWRAHWHYDQARLADSSEQAVLHLRRAVELDGRFPLYRARLAHALRESPQFAAEPIVTASLAHRAAEDAQAVAPLWLLAGRLTSEASPSEASGEATLARTALQRAMDLDPLAPAAPWLLLQLDPRPRSADFGAQAILAEPRLAGAQWWAERPRLWPHVREAIRTWPDLDPGWRDAFLEATADSLWQQSQHEDVQLTLDVDAQREFGLSSLLFRRQPWAWPLWTVPLDRVLEGF